MNFIRTVHRLNKTIYIWVVTDVSMVTQVAEATIRSAYKDLYPHAAKLIPDWFAKEVDLQSLHAPK
jgi:transcription initiation factor TFIIB